MSMLVYDERMALAMDEGQNARNAYVLRNQLLPNDYLPTLVEARPDVFTVSVPLCKCSRRADGKCVNCGEPVCIRHSYTPDGHNQPNLKETLCAECCQLIQYEGYLEKVGGRAGK